MSGCKIKSGDVCLDLSDGTIWCDPVETRKVACCLQKGDVVLVIAKTSMQYWYGGNWCFVLCPGPVLGWIPSICLKNLK